MTMATAKTCNAQRYFVKDMQTDMYGRSFPVAVHVIRSMVKVEAWHTGRFGVIQSVIGLRTCVDGRSSISRSRPCSFAFLTASPWTGSTRNARYRVGSRHKLNSIHDAFCHSSFVRHFSIVAEHISNTLIQRDATYSSIACSRIATLSAYNLLDGALSKLVSRQATSLNQDSVRTRRSPRITKQYIDSMHANRPVSNHSTCCFRSLGNIVRI